MKYSYLPDRRAVSVSIACLLMLLSFASHVEAQTQAARDAFQLAYACNTRDYDCQISNYTKAIQFDSNYASAYINRGLAYTNKGNYDAAIEDLNKAISLKSDAAAYNNRGLAHYRKGVNDLAIADFDKAIQLNDPKVNPHSYYNRGLTYYQKSNYDQAIADYTKAIQLKSDYADAYNDRGDAYEQKKSFDLAIGDYSKAIQMVPGMASAYYNRGYVYEEKGENDAAIADYNKAIALEPDNANFYLNRGEAYSNKRDFDPAIADETSAIRLNPSSARAYYIRGNAYDEKGSYDAAIADFNKAIELNPNKAAFYNDRGVTYAKYGQTELAVADYTKALQIDPKYRHPYSNRAWAYLFLNRGANAHQDAMSYLGLPGTDEDTALFMFIVGYVGLRKAGKAPAAAAFLKEWPAIVKQEPWQTQILKYFANQLTAAQLLALATDSTKQASAHTFIGERLLFENKKPQALVHFRWVRDNGDKANYSYVLSMQELKR